MTFVIHPKGTCSRRMTLEMDGDTVRSLHVEGGCSGNLQGIGQLIRGMKISEVVNRLEGIRCGAKSTSCPDQLAKGLQHLAAEKK